MSKRPVYVVDAFTGEALRGNAAGVVLDAGSLEPALMQRIAAELKHSETVFVSGARDPAASFHLRWFTPLAEVRFCGHATLAAIKVLVDEAQRLVVAPGKTIRTAFTSLSGVLRVEISRDPPASSHSKGRLQIRFETPATAFAQHILDESLLTSLGLIAEVLDPQCLPRRSLASHAAEGNLYLCVRERDALTRVRANPTALRDALQAARAAGVVVFTRQPAKGVDAALRCFFPDYLPGGAEEDPVTGSACGQLACLLQELFPEVMPRALRFTQGDELGRAGRVDLEVRPESTPGQIRAFVGGDATVVLRGELDLPAGTR